MHALVCGAVAGRGENAEVRHTEGPAGACSLRAAPRGSGLGIELQAGWGNRGNLGWVLGRRLGPVSQQVQLVTYQG